MKTLRNFFLANIFAVIPLLYVAFGWIPDRVKFELGGNSKQIPALVAGDVVLRGFERAGTEHGTLWKFYLGGGMEWKDLVFRLPDGMDASSLGPVRLEKWKLFSREWPASDLEKLDGEWNDYVLRNPGSGRIGFAHRLTGLGLSMGELLLLGLSWWAAKRHRPERWKPLLPSVLGVSFALALLMQVALPVQSYVANQSAFPFPPGMLCGAVALRFLLAFAAAVACLGVTARLFGRWVLAAALAFAVCAYLESGILSEGLPSLNGDLTLYTDRARGLKDAAVWFGVFAVFAGLHRWLKPWLGAAGLCMAVMAVAATFDAKPEKKADTSHLIVHDFVPVETVLRSVAYSTNRNVVVFVVDSLEREQAHAIMEDPEAGPRLREQFRGFTEYTNNVGACEHSMPAIANLMTGKFPGAIMDPDFYASVYSGDSVVKDYLEAGYAVFMGTDAMKYGYTNRGGGGTGGARPEDSVWTVHSRGNSGWGLASFCRFRWVPFIGKEPYAAVMSLSRQMVEDVSSREKTAYPILMAGGIAPGEKGAFLLVHTEGVHVPVLYNRRGEQLPAENDTDEGIHENGVYVMGLLGGLLDDYREKGIYDESLIIVLGDHGRHLWVDPGGGIKVFPCNGRPSLWVKPPRCDHPFMASGAPTSHGAICSLLKEAVGRDLDDQDVRAILSSEERIYRQQRESHWQDFHVAVDGSWRIELVEPTEVDSSKMHPVRLGQLIPLKFGIAEIRERGDFRFKGFPPQPGGRFLLGWRPSWKPGAKQVSFDFKVPSRDRAYRIRLVGNAWGGPPKAGVTFHVRGNDAVVADPCEDGIVEIVLDGVHPDEDGIVEIIGERDDACNSGLLFLQLEVTEAQGR